MKAITRTANVQPGDRRRTLWKKRVVVAVEQIEGKVEFYFEGEGRQPFCQRTSLTTWLQRWTVP